MTYDIHCTLRAAKRSKFIHPSLSVHTCGSRINYSVPCFSQPDHISERPRPRPTCPALLVGDCPSADLYTGKLGGRTVTSTCTAVKSVLGVQNGGPGIQVYGTSRTVQRAGGDTKARYLLRFAIRTSTRTPVQYTTGYWGKIEHPVTHVHLLRCRQSRKPTLYIHKIYVHVHIR